MDYIEDIFSNGGLLSQKLNGYKERKTQIQMAKAISQAIHNGENLIVEAPTGCGKSMGYLIPAIFYSKETNNSMPIVVATAKKVLQKQLFEKDLPFLKALLKDSNNFIYALVKGRNNYACNKKFTSILHDKKYVKGNVTYDELNAFTNFKSWYDNQIQEDGIGDIDDIEFDIPKSLLDEITITDNECTGGNCPYNVECFANRVRRDAAKANIIIVNYHILILDLQIKMLIAQQKGMSTIDGITAILPCYNTLILDEAHRFPEIVRDFSGFEISRYSLKSSIERLHKIIYASNNQGYINESELFAPYSFINRDDMVKKIKSTIEKFSAYLYTYMNSGNYNDILSFDDHKKLKKPVELLDMIFDVIDICSNLSTKIEPHINSEITDIEEEKKIKDTLASIEKLQGNFIEFRNNLNNIYDYIIDSEKWMDKNFSVSLSSLEDSEFAKMIIQPIYVHEHIKQLIYNNMRSVIATSATLRAGNDFEFFKKTTGFQGKELALKSEFDLKNQMQIIIDSKMPDPSMHYTSQNQNDVYQKYMDTLLKNIEKIIEKQQGGTLILATSKQQVFEIKKHLEKTIDYKILCQYDHFSLPKILSDFRKDRNSCLIGTNSLWEGIDIPGESLNSIVICKLPFKHMKDPISKSLELRGNNPFFEYSLPNAIISFIQGLGRLIRNESDSGIIYIADSRIANKPYGKNFLSFFIENEVNITHL